MGDYVLLCIYFSFFLYLVDMGMFVSGSVIILFVVVVIVVRQLLFRIMQRLEEAAVYRWYLCDVSIEC